MESNDAAKEPPNLTDCFLAGLELRRAVAFLEQIKRHPELEPNVWWALLSGLCGKPSH